MTRMMHGRAILRATGFQPLCWAFVALACVSCGGGSNSATNPPVATLKAITVTPANPTLQFGNSVQLVVTGSYSDGSTRDLSSTASWASTDPKILDISTSGVVTAVALGRTTVEATSGTVKGSTTIEATDGPATKVILHRFGPVPDGLQPNVLIQASDGNFYGTTLGGGATAHACVNSPGFCGTVFKVTPDGTETILHTFGATPTDGWSPSALIQGRDGNFYGTTYVGGTFNRGTFFKLTPAGVETVLYSFGASPEDGATPHGSLVATSDGTFYGTTDIGGRNSCEGQPNFCGTFYRITDAGVETVLYSFGAFDADGWGPNGLIRGSDGNFYGTTVGGGTNACGGLPELTHNCGTVFKITADGVEMVLHSFGESAADGFAPSGSLVEASDGRFYGTTSNGGGLPCHDANGCGGTVFRITPGGEETILHRFSSSPANEGLPSPNLTQASDGNFYGTTVTGGLHWVPGTAYRITPDGVKTILCSFGPTSADADRPLILMQARDGRFYGVSDEGGDDSSDLSGALRLGTFFELSF